MGEDRRACQHLCVDGHQPAAGTDPHESEDVVEVLDGEIVEPATTPVVTSDPRTVTPVRGGWNAAPVQTAVAAATGFVAGAATLALLRHYGLARAAGRELELPREEPRGRGGGDPGQLRGGTYLVSIRTLQTPQ
jgi:hypothetical protein